VADDEDLGPGVLAMEVVKRSVDPFEEGLGGFEPRWAPLCVEVAGPCRFDLVLGQSLPLAGVPFP
jgi:hypothetical protein